SNNDMGTITQCYSHCNVNGGTQAVGGLVGENNKGRVIQCYSTGRVDPNGEYIGGLVGNNLEGIVHNSFWDIKTSGQTESYGGIGKTTAEMQIATTFLEAGWDFVDETANGSEDIWFMPENDYPRLWWEASDLLFTIYY
ncbi:GLUG motif-containing protein, partial [Planctomycetota bacterium]